MQDLRRLGEAGRFAGVFAITILLPAAGLSYLALNSIRSEALSVEADLRTRANSIVEQVHGDLGSIFTRFEAATLERLRAGESPTEELGELSPYLRAAFRFAPGGALAAPFIEPDEGAGGSAPQSRAYEQAARAARALEADGDARAQASWSAARALASSEQGSAEARLGEARSMAAEGNTTEAELLLADIYADHAQLRDSRGFRVGDLVVLMRAQLRLDRGQPGVASTTLVELVETVLADHWTIGTEAEPAAVRRALDRLDGIADPDWVARARSRLNDRTQQLFWARRVAEELELVHGPNIASPGEFAYFGARLDSPAIWAVTRSGDNVYAFSFSVEDLYDDLLVSILRVNELEQDLEGNLLLPGDEASVGVLAVRQLSPWLPVVTLSVAPEDPDGLLRTKDRRRVIRIAVVLTAVFLVVVGVVWVARMIAWEVENARQRADFAANVSHELRSPLTQIRLKGEALQLGLVDPGDDMQDHFDAIVRESERLSRLVDNVLDFAAIERGAKRYQLRPDDLVAVVWSQVEAARASLEDRGLQLEIDVPDDLPPLWLDREAVGQVLTNLLSNAAKYGSDGGWVGVRIRQDSDAVRLEVADRGIGIARDELSRVFHDFFRSADPNVRKKKGTGIGLAIVRYIVEAHGGDITVESAPGAGATFIVKFPLEPPEGAGDRA